MKTGKSILKRLEAALQRFYPECSEQFLCPICLIRIPTIERQRISVAHILPKSARGGLSTLLCRTCNSTFGAKQDKWFGEYLFLVQNGGSFLDARAQQGYFEINGIRVPDGIGRDQTAESKSLSGAIRCRRRHFRNLRGALRNRG
jgi:hypothetical protein